MKTRIFSTSFIQTAVFRRKLIKVKKRVIIVEILKIFDYCLSQLFLSICSFSHEMVHIMNMVIINKQLGFTNKNDYREKKQLLHKHESLKTQLHSRKDLL